MARKATYSGAFFSSFAERLRGTEIQFGLLLGTPSEDGLRDAVFAAATPAQPQAEGAEAAPRPKGAAALLKSGSGGTPFADWAAEHGKQLRRLLPAGLEPCGCFAVVSEAAAKDLAPLLTPVLRGISDPLVLTIDGTSCRMSWWRHEGGGKPALRPTQLKPEAYKDALLLWTAANLDIIVPGLGPGLGAEACAERLGQAADAVLKRSTAALAPAVDGSPLRCVDFSSEQPLSSVVSKESSEARLHFLSSGTALTVAPAADGSSGGGASGSHVRCLVVATAVVLRRTGELRRAAELLRRSLATSLADRLRLALEEEEEDQREDGVGDERPVAPQRPRRLQLPWRALARPEACGELPIWCGDYCMPDEAHAAGVERLGELLGLPAAALAAAPPPLDERALLERNFSGTYAATDGGAGAKGASGKPGALGSRGVSACAGALIALALAAAVGMALQ